MARSRPAQGNNSGPIATAKPRYAAQPAPKVTSRGSVSRPKPGPRASYSPQPAPRRVSNPRTIA